MNIAFECVWNGIPEGPTIVFARSRNRARYVTARAARSAGWGEASYADVSARRRIDLDSSADANDSDKALDPSAVVRSLNSIADVLGFANGNRRPRQQERLNT